MLSTPSIQFGGGGIAGPTGIGIPGTGIIRTIGGTGELARQLSSARSAAAIRCASPGRALVVIAVAVLDLDRDCILAGGP